MSNIWDTKDGRRRVRRDPPTVEEAVLAAQGLTDETGEQAAIVASLMQISLEEARAAVLRMAPPKNAERVTIVARSIRSDHPAATRAVVVERRTPRRVLQSGSRRSA
ncbi:MAG: hypothetical protein WBF58_06900 [Xanthobacteraceae bacterium]